MTAMPDYYAHAAAALRRERRALAGRSPRMFAKTYLSGHCSLPFSRMHVEIFPEVCRPEGAPGQPNPWRSERILLPNGAMIAAYGTGQSLRGAKADKHRPGLIIADDIENQEQVIMEEQREKLRGWFNSTLLHAGHPNTNVVIVGTILHHDSLLAGLTDPRGGRGWCGKRYRAVEAARQPVHYTWVEQY